MQFLKEEIKPIKDYESLYELSNYGYIISLEKEWQTGVAVRKKGETILQTGTDAGGYPIAVLCKNRKRKVVKIHTLVWDYFGDEPRNGRKIQVDHKDEDKLNPRIDNLQLLTCRENLSKGWMNKKTSSKYTGVHLLKSNKKWKASIKTNGTTISLGIFSKEVDASNEYQRSLKEFNETGKITINTPAMKGKSSKYKGVGWNKRSKKWVTQIMIDRKHIHLGYFLDEYEAHLAYSKAKGEVL